MDTTLPLPYRGRPAQVFERQAHRVPLCEISVLGQRAARRKPVPWQVTHGAGTKRPVGFYPDDDHGRPRRRGAHAICRSIQPHIPTQSVGGGLS